MRNWKRALSFVLPLLAAGCTNADRFDRTHVSAGLEERTGRTIGPGDGTIPPAVTIEDGISEEEAVTLALWNNAAFQEALSELGLKRADLVQAGMIPNPSFMILFPFGPKQLEFTAKFPLEILWLRPARVAVAELDCERVSALLIQGGLDLVRDVRVAFADLHLARERAALAREAVEVRERLSDLAQARLRAGEASELEAGSVRAEALLALADAGRAGRDHAAAHERLRTLIGLSRDPRPLVFRESAGGPPATGQELPALLQRALATRPDLRSAELAVDGARERADLSEIEFLTATGLADANGSGKKGFEIGPGVDIPIPIFNQNQGGRSRAEAELERALRHQAAVQDRIRLEVREAASTAGAARYSRLAVQRALPFLEAAAQAADRAGKAGDVPPQDVELSRLKLLEGRLRLAESEAELRRAGAQLERSVGGRLP